MTPLPLMSSFAGPSQALAEAFVRDGAVAAGPAPAKAALGSFFGAVGAALGGGPLALALALGLATRTALDTDDTYAYASAMKQVRRAIGSLGEGTGGGGGDDVDARLLRTAILDCLEAAWAKKSMPWYCRLASDTLPESMSSALFPALPCPALSSPHYPILHSALCPAVISAPSLKTVNRGCG